MGWYGSATTVRRQWEQPFAGPGRRVADPPMLPAAERQLPRYSGQPQEELANVRYRLPPTLARQIRATATSLFPPAVSAPRTSALTEGSHPLQAAYSSLASTRQPIESSRRLRPRALPGYATLRSRTLTRRQFDTGKAGSLHWSACTLQWHESTETVRAYPPPAGWLRLGPDTWWRTSPCGHTGCTVKASEPGLPTLPCTTST